MPVTTEKESPQPGRQQPQIVPRIIPRSAHPISRNNIDREALKVLYRLRDAGHTAFLVGGGVRDLYLGKKPKDFDISTDAKPGELRKLFRNSRLIGRRFRLVQVFFHGGKIIEVSTFRRRNEHDITDGEGDKNQVLAANNTYGTPADDAFRRDLTINGLFYEIENFTIIDYTNGVADLDRGIVRIIGDPDRRLTRDPGRMLRVIRHAAQNNFTIEEKTWLAIKEHRQGLNHCPVSRIRDELMNDLHRSARKEWSILAIDSGLLGVILPCYENLLNNDRSCREKIANIMGVLDRLQSCGQAMADHLLLSALMVPWAESDLALMSHDLKGGRAHQFAKKLRLRIDEALQHLSVKRSTKEAITTLFANLPLFELYARENNWPKWLKRKSYFRECSLFHQIYRESRGGTAVDADILQAPASTLILSPGKAKSERRRRGRRRSKHRPAVTCKGNGSIFGLKKH